MKNHKMAAFLLAAMLAFVLAAAAQQKADETAVDPVCGMTVSKATAKATYEYKGTTYYFCNAGCKDAFVKDPDMFLQREAAPGGQMMKPGQGRMMHQKMAGQKGCEGCPMMAGKGMGQPMMGQGMKMAGGCCCAGCPMMSKGVDRKVENTPDGVTIRLSSKDPATVKMLQEHFSKMAAGCGMMEKGAGEKPAPKKD